MPVESGDMRRGAMRGPAVGCAERNGELLPIRLHHFPLVVRQLVQPVNEIIHCGFGGIDLVIETDDFPVETNDLILERGVVSLPDFFEHGYQLFCPELFRDVGRTGHLPPLRGEEIGVLFVDKNVLDNRESIDEKAQLPVRVRRRKRSARIQPHVDGYEIRFERLFNRPLKNSRSDLDLS
ncbi:MAG: hypothetical protein KJ042_13465 [Deltaproteobacteria bacterium]|nr:hypothetical protein [Deltaproteobacteria bacterium]